MTPDEKRGIVTKSKRKPVKRRFLFKAEWRGTALRFWIFAPNEKVAETRAARQVMRMEGGLHCLGLTLEREA